ncbi:MAG: hypothetical protein Q4B29_00215, partial [Candidatus Saccharibacteria bacterium]|nr:hypothetical protein [Candidatus Saccharibacteria bacterium]
YIVGVSTTDAEKIDNFLKNNGQHAKQKFMQEEIGLTTRFKVLSEIRAQNNLYQSMLPDDYSNDPITKQAEAIIYAVDDILNDARKICIEQMIRRKALEAPADFKSKRNSGSIFKEGPTFEELKGYWTPSRVQNWLIEKSLAKQKEEKGGDPKVEDSRDTFVQIISSCQKFHKLATDGELDEFRKTMKHNIELKDLDVPFKFEVPFEE